METPEVHYWDYGGVPWEFTVETALFVAQPKSKSIATITPSFPAILLPFFWLLLREQSSKRWSDDAVELPYPGGIVLAMPGAHSVRICIRKETRLVGWYLYDGHLRRMWRVVKKRRPDVAVAGVKLLRDMGANYHGKARANHRLHV